MKKVILIAVVFFCSIQAKAQVDYGIQVHGMLNSISFSEDEEIDSKSRIGFGAGIFAEYNLSPNFSIRPSLNFMQKGVELSSSFAEDELEFDQEVEVNLNYLELPVLFNYKPMEKWFIGAGPSIGYGISGKVKGNVTINDGETEETESIDIDAFKSEDEDGAGFKRLDFGLIASTGFNFTDNLSLQVSYLYGLSNISDSGEDDVKLNNRNLILSLGYKF